MSTSADGRAPGPDQPGPDELGPDELGPVDEDTAPRRPSAEDLDATRERPAAPPPAAPGPAAPPPAASPPAAPPPAPQDPTPCAPGFIDRAPFGRPAVPDQAPIHRFDQRPRFDTPPPAPHAPTPPPATPPAGAPPATPPRSAPPARPPGIDATGPRRRGLLLPVLAFGCAMLLLLGIGGGLAGLWWAGRDAAPSPSAGPATTAPGAESGTEPGVWEPLEPGQDPSGGPAELRQVLAENPLAAAQVQAPAECPLPAVVGGMVPEAELPAFLEAGADCLDSAWAAALDPAGIAVDRPEVVVVPEDAPPPDSACAAERFTGDSPVACPEEGTLYWPAAWDPGFSNTSEAEAPGLHLWHLWHLSYSYTLFVLAATDLDGYYGALQLSLADDPEQAEQAQRRYALQLSCLSSAAVFQLPEGVRPAERVEEFVTSVEAQSEPVTAGDPSPTSRAAWVTTGRDSGGDLSQCAAWTAGADAVA